jgi:hypothetical protein
MNVHIKHSAHQELRKKIGYDFVIWAISWALLGQWAVAVRYSSDTTVVLQYTA